MNEQTNKQTKNRIETNYRCSQWQMQWTKY